MKTCLIVGMGIGKLYEQVLTELGHGVITVDADLSKGADFTNVDDAVRECRLFDTVHICTPNFTHMKFARKLAAVSGIVFVEKPGVADDLAWKQLVQDYPKTHFMMVKNNMWRDNIAEMREAAQNSKRVQLNWINKNRVPNPGTWFTTRDLAYGGVSRDLMPHLLSLYIALNPDWVTDDHTDFFSEQRWKLSDLVDSDYGKVDHDGTYDVDDIASIVFNGKWQLTANWRSNHEDERNIVCADKTFELGLCPESAYKAMIADAIENKTNDEFWQNQYSQDMWIHSIMQLWM